MLRKLVHTSDDHTLTLLRLILGLVFFAHGAQKVLGWFGGPGWSGAMGFFTQGLNIPAFFAVVAILAEFLGGIGLILGLLGRVAAIAIAIEMVVAVLRVHLTHGFFMNWAGNKAGEGFEFHLLAIAMGVVLTLRGAGALSLDRVIQHWLARSRRIDSGMPYPQPAPGA